MNLTRRTFIGAVPAALLAAPTPVNPAGARDAMLKLLPASDCWSAAKMVGAEVVEVSVDDNFSLPLVTHPQGPYVLNTDEGLHRLSTDLRAAGTQALPLPTDCNCASNGIRS